MCSINHELKAIFIHIPKCGGLFIEKILTDFYDFTTYYFTHEKHSNFVLQDRPDSADSADSADFCDEMSDEMSDVMNDDKTSQQKRKTQGFLHITNQGVLRYFMSSVKHSEKQNMNMEKWNEYTKFAFIRNPYDKIVSAWKYINKLSLEPITFKDFLKSKDTCTSYTYFHAFITQYEQLLNIDNELKIDFFGKFEELNDNLANILLKINLDEKINHANVIKNSIKFNSSGNTINYIGYYTNELIQIVNELFEIDFIKFGFKKCKNMNELIEDSALYFVSDEMFASNNEVLLNKLTTNNNIDISEDKSVKVYSDEDKVKNKDETINKKEIPTLSVNGLTINIDKQINSACKNIIYENPVPVQLNDDTPRMSADMLKNMSQIHLEGVMEVFRRASEITKNAVSKTSTEITKNTVTEITKNTVTETSTDK